MATTRNQVDVGLKGQTGSGTFVGSISPTITTPIIVTIKDANGVNTLTLGATVGAVNYMTVINNTTGNPPVFNANGTDTNISIGWQAKGTGAYEFFGTADTAAEMRLYEDTDNGNNYVAWKAPASIAANVTWIMPSADSAGVFQSNGSGTFVLTRNPYLDTIIGINNKTVLEINDNSASAVNYVAVGNNITSNAPAVQAKGTDSNISLDVKGKGTGGAMIQGVSTNSNASAGYVGELISSVISSGSAISITTATPANITSISLTAGDWDVWGNTFAVATSFTGKSSWISTTSAVLPDQSLRNNWNDAGNGGGSVPAFRFSLSATTTIYLSIQCSFTGTGTAMGGIYARRRR